ncbi:hypothetical protein PPACK8108_LOCUS22656 [Phakopsora pachyrhizi]|uniref:Uncharacterized protein n=1 Tax=Phakopsora pachyrhizi TaxID=170000 RepID=A0AAV0BP58_PHAPC|nr:hypothetical protein PPACK8108_LOCUS22656 [Phakopsora pachyrhizi]
MDNRGAGRLQYPWPSDYTRWAMGWWEEEGKQGEQGMCNHTLLLPSPQGNGNRYVYVSIPVAPRGRQGESV